MNNESDALTRIANALEAIIPTLNIISSAAAAIAAKEMGDCAPALKRPISEYASFDWGSIGAQVVEQDEYGATFVFWGGHLWERRTPTGPRDKFGQNIWYSRSRARRPDEPGDKTVIYLRLITFYSKQNQTTPIHEGLLKTIEESTPLKTALPPPATASSSDEKIKEARTKIAFFMEKMRLTASEVLLISQGMYGEKIKSSKDLSLEQLGGLISRLEKEASSITK